MVDINAATHVRKVLQDALNALDKNVAAHTNMTGAGHAGSERA
jgi:hypothetical protein